MCVTMKIIICQEMNRGRSEQEVLEELGDPRLIARTILETSGMKAQRWSIPLMRNRQIMKREA